MSVRCQAAFEHRKWLAGNGTSQDLEDQCEAAGATSPGYQVDSTTWTFADGSSVEIVWGSPNVIVRDADGDRYYG